MTERDHVLASGKWAFDGDVARVFDDMLARSIPQYELMRRTTLDVASHFADRNPAAIVDLGCSRGEALAPFVERYGAKRLHVGVEISEPMADAVAARFAHEIAGGFVSIRREDLRRYYPPERAAVVLAILTVQFVPIEYRLRLLRSAWASLEPGGCLVLVEKVLGATADLDALMVDRYLAMKRDHGYSEEEIERKRLALEGVLVPVTAAMNVDLLRGAGFVEIDCFWRWMNFAGFVGVRP